MGSAILVKNFSMLLFLVFLFEEINLATAGNIISYTVGIAIERNYAVSKCKPSSVHWHILFLHQV